MQVQIENKVIDAARLYILKSVAPIVNIPYPTLYLRKLKGEFEVVTIGGVEFIVEPEEGFKKMLAKKKKGVKK